MKNSKSKALEKAKGGKEYNEIKKKVAYQNKAIGLAHKYHGDLSKMGAHKD